MSAGFRQTALYEWAHAEQYIVMAVVDQPDAPGGLRGS